MSASCALCCALLAPLVQAQETVLKPSQVTEEALLDALNTGRAAAPACADGAAQCRGFGPLPAARPVKPNAGKANLLITFETDSAELTAESRATLDVVARALQSDTLAGEAFRIEGHADPRGNDEHNLKLSQARAEAVSRYLVEQRAILPMRLSAIGRGSSQPLNTRQPDAPENRRVSVVVVPN
jgi:outer membrane protein OmpA-like peptidoglycan-associated protein